MPVKYSKYYFFFIIRSYYYYFLFFIITFVCFVVLQCLYYLLSFGLRMPVLVLKMPLFLITNF